mgnify:CR=1 FL=1
MNEFTLRKARKRFDDAVRHLLQTTPTLGVVLLEKLIIIHDHNVPSMCTNGVVLRYNAEFVMTKSKLNLVFVIAHEVMHCLMFHTTRRKNRDGRLWNIAGDYCINTILNRMSVGKMPEEALYDLKYDCTKLTTEALYKLLMDEADEKRTPPPKDKEASPGGDAGTGGTSPEGEPDTNPPPEDRDGIAEQFEKQIEQAQSTGWCEDYIPEDNVTIDDDGVMMVGLPQEIEDQFSEALTHGEFAAEKAVGKGTFSLKEAVEINNKVSIDWEDALREFLSMRVKVKKNWLKPNNKWLQHGFWMPSKGGKGIKDIVVMIDESGSMSEREVNAVFTNLSILFESGDIPLSKVALLHFASTVDHVDIIESGELPEYLRRTNGGTDFEEAFDKAKEMEEEGEIDPACYIVMTDMYAQTPPEPEHPVLWMSTTNPADIEYWIPEYGRLTHLEVGE